MSSDVLIVGASGLVGRALLRQCAAQGGRPLAITRQAAPEADVAALADWRCGVDLVGWTAVGRRAPVVDTLIGAGPLDALADWLANAPPIGLRRVVALSSTSVLSKPNSSDPAERAIARRLADGEQRLIAACDRLGAGWTLLRPTLIWGEGRDRNISQLAAFARRHGRIVLPRFARGLRQPIRAADVAAALLAAAQRSEAAGLCLDLPGGETLAYDEMARRIAAAVAPPGRVSRWPLPAWSLSLAAALGAVSPGRAAMLQRTRVDLVFDGAPAALHLGVRPAGFQPVAGDFPMP